MANLYTISDLLIGKQYRSPSLVGTIVYAEETTNVMFGAEEIAYLVTIREDKMIKDNYRYIAVRIEA